MDFSFAPEQVELADALQRRLQGDRALPRRPVDTGLVWSALIEMGVAALTVSQSYGGYGGSVVDLLPTMQTLGRVLGFAPLWSTAVAAKAIEWGGTSSLCEALLPRIANGSASFALALFERASRHDLCAIQTSASRSDGNAGGYTLQGHKTVVLFGAQVGYWLVSALTDGAPALFVVPADTARVHVMPYRCIDGLPAVDLRFDAVFVPAGHRLIAAGSTETNDPALLHRVSDYGAALLCAEALGLMELAKEATVSHLQTRHQFGSPLAGFQALQHRVVEITMKLEQARSITCLAATKACSEDMLERTRSVAAAKALVGEIGLFIGRQCVQLHGAIGLTEEASVSHVLKRLTMIDQTLGDSDHHYVRFADLQTCESTRRL